MIQLYILSESLPSLKVQQLLTQHGIQYEITDVEEADLLENDRLFFETLPILVVSSYCKHCQHTNVDTYKGIDQIYNFVEELVQELTN